MRRFEGHQPPPRDAWFAVVCARFNAPLTDRLLDGCLARFAKAGVEAERIDVAMVPGAFEIPTVARQLALSGRYRAVVCLGAVVRGATPHFDFVAGECARGIAAIGLETGVPTIFGVITTDTWAQAEERALPGLDANKGADAAEAALQTSAVLAEIAAGKGQASRRTRAAKPGTKPGAKPASPPPRKSAP
ncbi:MAG: 6,7-dimethyl-8-ribityllumazine synthase [Planctomycetota bacterium]